MFVSPGATNLMMWRPVQVNRAAEAWAEVSPPYTGLLSERAAVSTLSPIQWHLDGRAVGFFVGVHRSELGTDGEHVDLPDRFDYACSETAPPTAEAIGDLAQEALENARV
jgi:hypothetical protein